MKLGIKPENEEEDGYDFGNDPNESYSSANPNYHHTTGWLIGDIQTTKTVNLLWGYQLSNIIEVELGIARIIGIDESIHSMSFQINIDY